MKIWRGRDAALLREEFPERIMSSRMVRRKKPMPGLHQYKAKSRFCDTGIRIQTLALSRPLPRPQRQRLSTWFARLS